VDSNGASRFRGSITDPRIIGRTLSAEEIADLAGKPRTEDKALPEDVSEVAFRVGCTTAAWIKPAGGEAGRILDKCTAGLPDGVTFDTHPGLSLRWIVGRYTMIHPRCLQPGQWQHVAATVEAGTGMQRIYLNGKLVMEGRGNPDEEPAARIVTEAYALQRFVTACAGRGALPIKFNGSLFTVDQVFDPDYRRWGGAYWWQNTRLPYWSMLYSGDYDLMQPLFKMYMDALPLRKAATKKYYGHDGAFYPETMYFWGNYTDGNYGLNREGKPDGLTDNGYIRRYWQGGLELVGMMLDYYDATQDAAFRENTLLPFAKETVLFFDQHWKRGADGKVFYSPAQSLETWHVATNPLPEIVGLRHLLPRLLALPVDEATKAQWRTLLADQPAVPAVTKDGKAWLLPAQTYSHLSNCENPELYAVFPYRAYTKMTGGEELQIGINTWNSRRNRANIGWQQQPIQAALLGLAAEAKALVVQRARSKAGGYRFPGFYGPNYDWTPDQDQISVFMIGLQRMLMQCQGDRILLLPAWPKEWNVSFKLHAPRQTTVEGVYRDGKFESLTVTPESRARDVVRCEPQ
jgi:alpha-L-fucosidase 2